MRGVQDKMCKCSYTHIDANVTFAHTRFRPIPLHPSTQSLSRFREASRPLVPPHARPHPHLPIQSSRRPNPIVMPSERPSHPPNAPSTRPSATRKI